MQATELQSYNPLMILWSYDLVILLQSPRFQIFYLLRNSCCNPIIINDLMKFSSQKPHISREHGDIWYCCEVVSKRSIFLGTAYVLDICSWWIRLETFETYLNHFVPLFPLVVKRIRILAKMGYYATVQWKK